nr:hypothetical protein GZ9D8_26 [uncultured archaeon GZfos9D8]
MRCITLHCVTLQCNMQIFQQIFQRVQFAKVQLILRSGGSGVVGVERACGVGGVEQMAERMPHVIRRGRLCTKIGKLLIKPRICS